MDVETFVRVNILGVGVSAVNMPMALETMSFWENRNVLITGGASFIGSHLTDALVERGAKRRLEK